MGASDGCDGVDRLDCSFANLPNNPIVSVEASGRLRIVQFGPRPDSGGPGRRRGGHRERRAASGAGSAPPPSFDFGPERLAWERAFPDAAMAALNARLHGRPLAERTALRQRLIREGLPGIAQGVSVAELVRTFP